jgi:hypothetical protein
LAGRAKIEAPVHCAATSIPVELSRYGEVKEYLGMMCECSSKEIPCVTPDIEIIQEKGVEESILKGKGEKDFVGLFG